MKYLRKCKLLLVFICLFAGTLYGWAQNKKKPFYFVYIAHNRTTPVQRLCKILIEQYKTMRSAEIPCIFYLANRESPYVVSMNLPNDNSGEFESKIVGELQNKVAHDINPNYDIEQIVELFNQNEIVNGDGTLAYPSVTWDIYINKSFWNQYNESFIASLYWTMELDKLKEEEFYLNIYLDKNSQIDGDKDSLFGPKNLANINDDIILLTY